MFINYTTGCWIIMPGIVKQICERLLKKHANEYWTIEAATAEQLCQRLPKRKRPTIQYTMQLLCNSVITIDDYASHSYTIEPTDKQIFRWILYFPLYLRWCQFFCVSTFIFIKYLNAGSQLR